MRGRAQGRLQTEVAPEQDPGQAGDFPVGGEGGSPSFPSAGSAMTLRGAYERFLALLEKMMLPLTVGSFAAGILIAKYSAGFTGWINSLVGGFVEGYGIIAPVAIFLILTPSLARMFKTRSLGRFGAYVIWWSALRKLMACFWGVLFTAVVFQLPFFPQQATSIGEAALQTVQSLSQMMTTSPYFWAMYLSVGTALIATKARFLFRVLEKTLDGVEAAGRFFIPFIPLFMLAIGAYVYGLPAHLGEQIELEAGMEQALQPFTVLGLSFHPESPLGMIWIYVFGALLVGLACFLWHLGLLLVTQTVVKRFSIRRYFADYWVKIYPLLWATSSEALATPLNLYLTKRHAPWVRSTVRRLVVGMGSWMNINGTLICVIVLGAIVFSILGIQVSVVEWLLVIPVILLISYGVPGIPGELVLFAGPIAILLNLPESIAPTFLAVYIGLQIGLPDSFRTGNNSTDNYVFAILLNDIYEKRFAKEGEDEDAE